MSNQSLIERRIQRTGRTFTNLTKQTEIFISHDESKYSVLPENIIEEGDSLLDPVFNIKYLVTSLYSHQFEIKGQMFPINSSVDIVRFVKSEKDLFGQEYDLEAKTIYNNVDAIIEYPHRAMISSRYDICQNDRLKSSRGSEYRISSYYIDEGVTILALVKEKTSPV